MPVLRVLRAWRGGRGVIPSALFCSLLTCIASTASNLAFAMPPQTTSGRDFAWRLLIGYSGAALVVVTVFPVLPEMYRAAAVARRRLLPGPRRRRA